MQRVTYGYSVFVKAFELRVCFCLFSLILSLCEKLLATYDHRKIKTPQKISS